MATNACSEKLAGGRGSSSGGRGSLAAVAAGLAGTRAQNSSMGSCWPLQAPRCPSPASAHGAVLAQISSEASNPALTPTLPGCKSLSSHPSASPHPYPVFSPGEEFVRGLLKDKVFLHIYLWH